jgi:hypothetical protein
MDPGTGRLVPTEEAPDGSLREEHDGPPIPETWVPFRVGELVTIKGARFKIEEIRADSIMLLALGRKQRRRRKRRRHGA